MYLSVNFGILLFLYLFANIFNDLKNYKLINILTISWLIISLHGCVKVKWTKNIFQSERTYWMEINHQPSGIEINRLIGWKISFWIFHRLARVVNALKNSFINFVIHNYCHVFCRTTSNIFLLLLYVHSELGGGRSRSFMGYI